MQIKQMLLEAVSAALDGEKVSWTDVSEECWDKLMSLSVAHKMQPLVFNSVFDCPAAENWSGFSAQKRLSKSQMLMQTLKTTEFQALYTYLRENGITPLVVKGILCRSVYPNPDLRQSSDEDLFVEDASFEKCCSLLATYGFQPTSEKEISDSFEIGWRKSSSPLYIELHKSLFSPESTAVNQLIGFFDQAFDRAQEYKIDGMTYLSLCPHDHLLYLILHAYKHFIHSGFGIRQICDIGLWVKTFAEKIDWDELYRQCKEAHVLKFATAIFEVADKNLKIKFTLPETWKEITVDGEPLLIDALRAGIYGSADQSRAHSASVTFNTVAAQRAEKHSSILQSVFPSKKALENEYPILKKSAFYLPYVWCVRIRKYRKETKNAPDNRMSEALRIAQERKQLLKYYDIIEP